MPFLLSDGMEMKYSLTNLTSLFDSRTLTDWSGKTYRFIFSMRSDNLSKNQLSLL